MIRKEEVIERYNRSSEAFEDYEKGLWGSEQSMLGRFRLAQQTISWETISRWLDVGCGVGRFFSFVDSDGIKVAEKVGIDISPKIINQAQQRRFNGDVLFQRGDIEHLSETYTNFHLITLIGVLQLCGCGPDVALAECAKSLRLGGQLFLTTKNIGWSKFADPSFKPSTDHDWFDCQTMIHILEGSGFRILRKGGILPSSGQLVRINESHTMYFLAEKAFPADEEK